MINEILTQRANTHGNFTDVSITAQHIKKDLMSGKNYNTLSPIQRECIDMVASKLSRIVNGNPDEKDHWVDIAGYATLVANTLE